MLAMALGLLVLWLATAPRPLPSGAIPQHTPDLANGGRLYHAAGCHSCHLPAAQSGIDPGLPAGGTAFKTPVGTLYPPNITPDRETGIGQWSDLEFVNAVQEGIGRDGTHLVPAFPYTSYARMKVEDVLDIRAYLNTLAPVRNAVPPHDVFALALIRLGLGGWKWIGFDDSRFTPDAGRDAAWNRGAYLVNGPGHCGECHTPRTLLMTSDQSRFLAGGPHPEGEGKVPSLRDLVGRNKYKDAADLVLAFQNGEIFGYENMSSGGMGKVQANLAKLPEEDLKAIAAYLLSLK